MNKKARSKKNPEAKSTLRVGFNGYNSINSNNFLTSDTTYSIYLLIVDAYSKILKNYGMEKITTEEVMDNLDIFKSRFGKIDEFAW